MSEFDGEVDAVRSDLTDLFSSNDDVVTRRSSASEFTAGAMSVVIHHFDGGGRIALDLGAAAPRVVVAFPFDRRIVLSLASSARFSIAPGEPFFVRTDTPFAVEAKPGLHLLTVAFPVEDMLAMGVAAVGEGGPLERASRLVKPIRAFFRELALGEREGTNLSTYVLETLGREMTSSLLMRSVGLSAPLEGMRPSLFDEAQAVIASRRADPDLTPTLVARDLSISVRQLQRAFEAMGTSPAAEIRSSRTQLALTLLSDPAYAVLGIGEIAQHAGFRSTADLRRAVTAATGMPPREYRAHAAS